MKCPVCDRVADKLYDINNGEKPMCRHCALDMISEKNNGIGYVCLNCAHKHDCEDFKWTCRIVGCAIDAEPEIHTCHMWKWDEGKSCH